MVLDLSLTATFNFTFEEDDEGGIKYSVTSSDSSDLSLGEMSMLSEILSYIEDEKIADMLHTHLRNSVALLEANEETAPEDESEATPEDA